MNIAGPYDLQSGLADRFSSNQRIRSMAMLQRSAIIEGAIRVLNLRMQRHAAPVVKVKDLLQGEAAGRNNQSFIEYWREYCAV